MGYLNWDSNGTKMKGIQQLKKNSIEFFKWMFWKMLDIFLKY